MYQEIFQALVDRGCDEWTAGMTAEKISDVGVERVRDVLNELLDEL